MEIGSDRKKLIIGVIILLVLVIGIYAGVQNTSLLESSPNEFEYSVEPSQKGFLIAQETGGETDQNVTIEITSFDQKDREYNVDLPRANTPAYIETTIPLNSVNQVKIKYEGEVLHTYNHPLNYVENGQVRTPQVQVSENETLEMNISEFVDDKGTVQSYTWNTDLDIIENERFVEKYPSSGLYNATLKITYNNNQTVDVNIPIRVLDSSVPTDTISDGSGYIVVNMQPNERLTLNSERVLTNTSDPTDIRWVFNDGTESGQDTITKEYDQIGVYEVQLRAKTADGDTITRKIGIKVTQNISTDIVVKNQNGYEFEYEVITDKDGLIYEWDFGDGTTETTQDSDIKHTYDEYGEYNVSVTIRDPSTGFTQTESKSVETEVIVEMGNEAYTVTSVSGNHDELLMPNSSFGEINPQLFFQKDTKYVITDIPINISFISEDDEILLGQGVEGSLEDDPDINWREVGDDTVKFTVTSELGGQIYGYRPTDNFRMSNR